ncbi:carbohydrate ABC transporter permease [Paenibacillus alba]|uniref:Carbohydrate ABC transporter permease n=1 Tax=Paenibacillus alba TaxID=1197127 RepID=A0ABU6GD44_9BACL|nr:carbohydrate ABC transporter permease [Paenibacillus alba]MEC0232131.1 carbohydrate ABC transporter permease [Paenibacillus alba]
MTPSKLTLPSISQPKKISSVKRSNWADLSVRGLLIIIAVIQLFPLVWLVDFSLLKSGDFFGSSILKWPNPPQWINYKNAFTQGKVPAYFLNSAIVTTVTIVATVISSLTMAYACTRMQWKLRKVFYNLMLVGMIIPVYSTLIPNFQIFNKLGMLNSYWSLILPNVAFSIPLAMFILSGFMESIPRSLEEAAVMDGLGLGGIIYRIILPITKPAITTVTVMTFISTWNEFIMAITYIRSETFKTLPFALVQFTGQYASNYAAQFAVMALIALPSVVIYFIFTEQITSSVTAGAVKG